MVSVLVYGSTTWTLTKLIEKKQKNATSYTEQILEATPHKKHLYGHLPLISKTIQIR